MIALNIELILLTLEKGVCIVLAYHLIKLIKAVYKSNFEIELKNG